MRKSTFTAMAAALALALPAGGAVAAVSEAEADRLGRDLTPLGGIRAGNQDGTIPAWDGGMPQRDLDLDAGETFGNPFADDQIRFVIDIDNYRQFEDQLAPGQVAMIEAFPDSYRIPVYPTRRTASYPESVYEWTRRNAVNANLEGTDGLTGAYMGAPFPIPTRGEHPIWNHKTRYRGEGARVFYNQAIVTGRGDYSLVRLLQEILFFYSMEDMDVETLEANNEHFRFLQHIVSPARLAGGVLLVHEPLDQVRESRQAWIYNPGQRRVRRAPNVEHDNPGTAADGLRTNDQNDIFNGSLERYDWELVGLREMYMPYNSFELQSFDRTYEDILDTHHINQDLARYELRRVWMVDATVREGMRHLYPRRTFYVDEDSWQILHVDVYDNRGQLWRVQEAHNMNFFVVPAIATVLETVYDLQSRRYLVLGLNNEDPPSDYRWAESPSYFTPANLRQRGRR